MLELPEDEVEHFVTYIIKSKQRTHIKIETLHGNTVPITHVSLKEVCGNATLDRSTVQWWHKHFRENLRKKCSAPFTLLI